MQRLCQLRAASFFFPGISPARLSKRCALHRLGDFYTAWRNFCQAIFIEYGLIVHQLTGLRDDARSESGFELWIAGEEFITH